ncbi:Cell division protein FtsK [Actinacidiphila bryophytorum]|uniref:Cell division protein FtsK n=1 Tax=Actinacidiphila bryophytorum TaxID=1436133 RepID=A0A9W4H050_9ACTN|nr:Cell division protein FtsK [Actinacidiphila bryophytorum]
MAGGAHPGGRRAGHRCRGRCGAGTVAGRGGRHPAAVGEPVALSRPVLRRRLGAPRRRAAARGDVGRDRVRPGLRRPRRQPLTVRLHSWPFPKIVNRTAARIQLIGRLCPQALPERPADHLA